jgi:hypothetical protein
MAKDNRKAADIVGASNDKAEAIAQWHKERKEAQAIEEISIWGEIDRQAQVAVVTRKPRTVYTDALGEEIAIRMASGQSLNSICKLDHMPHISTVFDWIRKEPSFADKYTLAREHAAHALFDQMIDIADDCSKDVLEDGTPNNAAIQRAKLQIDTRARVAGKLAPKVFGERVDTMPMVNVTNNSLTISSRDLSPDQRSQLRELLSAASNPPIIEG